MGQFLHHTVRRFGAIDLNCQVNNCKLRTDSNELVDNSRQVQVAYKYLGVLVPRTFFLRFFYIFNQNRFIKPLYLQYPDHLHQNNQKLTL